MSAPAAKRNNRKTLALETVAVAVPDPPTEDLPVTVEPASEASDLPGPKTEEIARLAYSYWEARDCQGGSAEEDWLRAERELRRVVKESPYSGVELKQAAESVATANGAALGI